MLQIRKIRNSRTLESWLAGWLTEGAFLRELVISLRNPLIERVPGVRKQENLWFLRMFQIFQIFLIFYRLGKLGTPVLWRAGWLAGCPLKSQGSPLVESVKILEIY